VTVNAPSRDTVREAMGGKDSESSSGGPIARGDRGPSEAPPDAAAESRERSELLAALASAVLVELDREGRSLRTLSTLTGSERAGERSVDDLLGFRGAESIAAAAGARLVEALRVAFDTGMPTAFECSLDAPAGPRAVSCEVRPHAVGGEAVGGEGRGPRTVSLLVRDAAAAKTLQATVERHAARAVPHAGAGESASDVGTQLDATLAILERALTALDLRTEGRDSLESVRGSANRIAEIASSLDLLAARRPRTSRTVDIERPLEAALELCAAPLDGLFVERMLPELPLVHGRHGELCQAFTNLILDAAEAMPASGGRPRALLVTGDVIGERVRIRVGDRGAGIALEELEAIFDPFSHRAGGRRFGLFVARAIVEALGGALDVASELGRGTNVDVFLPIVAPSPLPEAPATDVDAAKPHSTTSRRRLKLLLVDDEPRFLYSLRLALRDTHEVDTCDASSEALALLEQDSQRYDVVLCDLAMPEIDGVTFFEQMQSLGVEDRFLLMTGGAFTARAAEFVSRRACRSIEKPFMIDRLLALLDEVSRSRPAS
jgi:signal transduction histidine kinase/ActR/RegA family two-component response regulator